MLPQRLSTSLVLGEGGKVDPAGCVYEFPSGLRTPFDLSKPEKRLKFTFQDDHEDEGEGEEGDDTNSVVSSASHHVLSLETEQTIRTKLSACVYELAQLSEVLQAKELGSIRIERAPQSQFEREQSLALAQIKRQGTFTKAIDMLAARTGQMHLDVHHGRREYFKNLELLARKFRIVAPNHGTTALSSLKPDEPLAIDIAPFPGSAPTLVHIRRNPDVASGLSLSLGDYREALEDFKAQALEVELFVNREARGRGSAKTQGFHKCLTEHETIMEAVIRDHLAKEMFHSLDVNKRTRVELDENTHLEFKLAHEGKHADLLSLNKFDGICSLALNLLQRGKSLDCIQLCCTHLLHFSMLDSNLGGLAWEHSEDETDQPELVETRCQVSFARSGRYAAEFFSNHKRKMQLDWHTFEDFFLDESGGGLAEVIGRGHAHATCLELMAMVNTALTKFKAERVSESSFALWFQHELVAKITVSPPAICELEELGGMGGGMKRDVSANPFYELRKLIKTLALDSTTLSATSAGVSSSG
ncbi:hypothetical protein BASA81_002004 [Batrachochytrium salamandrivorans]|nr:hypothetical protein BASA81_002004 [Batrachochytrium salamandrivorans]